MPKNLNYIITESISSSAPKESQSFSQDCINEYLHSQRDPVIGTQTGRCTFHEEDDQWKMKSSLPIAINFPKDTSEISVDWDTLTESEAQGNALWKYSVGYLPTLLELSGSAPLVIAILDSLWEYTQSSDWHERAQWMTSLDHCLAVRLRALCTLEMLFQSRNIATPNSLYRIVGNDIITIINGGDSFFPINNHGAMAAISMLHADSIFPQLSKSAQEVTGESASSIGFNYLGIILDNIFDSNGIASENSPEYQRYWITLLSPLIGLQELFPQLGQKWKELGKRMDINHIVGQAHESLLLFLDSDGRLIPIGDTHPRRLKERGPNDREVISEKLGFALYRKSETILTFNCGSTNYAHKHCDDTSITLNYSGKNLLLDAGYFSHDWNDARTIFSKSQTAHSGLYFTNLDNLHPGKLYWPGKERIRATLKSLTDDIFHVEGIAEIDGRAYLRRELKVVSPERIDILDSVSGEVSNLGSAVRRFVIPLGAKVTTARGIITITLEDTEMNLVFDQSSDLDSIAITTAQSSPYYKGWISPELNTLEPATCIEIPIHSPGRVVTRILLRRKFVQTTTNS